MNRILWCITLILILFGCKKNSNDNKIRLSNAMRYTFTIKVKGYWDKATHPTDYPAGAKFGKILGVTHSSNNLLFDNGQYAQKWLKDYLVNDNTSTFDKEFKNYKVYGKVDAVFNNEGLGATKSIEFDVTTTGEYDKLSLISKITPSSDWFIGVKNIDLNPLAKARRIAYIVKIYDGGCKSGDTYTNVGSDTSEYISYRNGKPMTSSKGGIGKFATVIIVLKNIEKIK